MSEDQEIKTAVSYEEFKAFYDRHPNMDNTEYYTEFPGNVKSTIRSWKTKANKPEKPETPPTPKPDDPYEEDYFNILCQQTGTPASEFTGVDKKSAIIILKNRKEAQSKAKPTPRPGNSGILPSPKPIGQSTKKFGIDPFIVFDGDKNEITMEIPLDMVMDPEKNKELRKVIR